MTAPAAPGDPEATGSEATGAEPSGAGRPAPGTVRPYDPERGLRGIMSATLILEAISVLLSIPVAANTDGGVGALGISLICLLALLLVLACGVVSRPYAIQVILGLQVLAIAGWLITPSLGGIGIVFSIAWAVILWFRAEFRRRLAAGTLPGPPQPSGS